MALSNSPEKKNECLTDVNQQRPPSYSRKLSLPLVNAANQNDGSRINDMHPFQQSKNQLSSENKGQPREAYRERSYNHVPSKEKKGCSAQGMMECQQQEQMKYLRERVSHSR